MSSQTLQLLSSTLNPSLLQSCQREIQQKRTSQGFATDLMIIADDNNNDIKIRQSALIVLKNMIYDECSKGGAINRSDYQLVKGSILDALARQWGNKYLVPTLREIIYLIAEIDYPQRWPNIVDTAIGHISNSKDFSCVSSSVQALKAITSVCGRSLQHQITLNNLCNKIVIPLFQLANKLFANYTPQTQQILTSIFKIFNLAMFYHLPTIFMNNIHSLMIFCKKIVDLNIQEMVPLKIACLKILSRMYSRHTGSNVGYKLLKFAQDFHEKYSILMTQSFILQLMNANNNSQVINLSLNCLTCIYKNHQNSANLIQKHTQKLLQLCLLRFKMKNLKTGQSVGSFITHIKQQRNQLIDFISALFNQKQSILGDLIQHLNKGDQSIQQLVLYIFSGLSQQVQDYSDLYQSMSQFIVTYILPILSGNSSTILKARGCQIISSYKYVQLPSQNLQSIFQFIYSCLTQSKDSYLNIYALQAFTQLICKYDNFLTLIIPYLQDILKVYTSLMKQSNGQVYQVIKSFQLFIGHLNGNDIGGCAIDLVRFLLDLFYQYAQQQKNGNNNNNNNDDNQSQSGQQDQQQDQSPTHARQGCLACIRQIIAIQNLPKQLYPQLINNCILPLSVFILSDKQLLHFQQCLNILNLCLYKSNQLPHNFDQFFKIFSYAIIGIPNQLGSINNLSNQYKQILMNVCINPDQDIISNVVGFFRNFIAKANNKLRDFKDQIGINFMQYIFKIVSYIQQQKITNNNNNNNNNNVSTYKYKKSDRLLILTLYTSLLEYQILNSNQFQFIVNNLMLWYSNSTNQSISASENNAYIQILLICVYYNLQLTTNKLNTQWLIQTILQRVNIFKYQYQLQRLLLGITKMIDKQVLKNQNSATLIMKLLPNIVYKLISQRIKQQFQNNNNNNNNNDNNKQQKQQIDIQQQAQQDLIAQNTHLGTFPPRTQLQKKKQQQLIACQQAQWDQQYNKYYYSPFININQLEYLIIVLKNSQYTSIMTNQQQQKLTQYLCNAPQKNKRN